MNGLLAISIVLGLLLALAWLARRGHLGNFRSPGTGLAVERGIALGERRSLVIVAVEGRRFLLGLTPATVSLVTELDRVSPDAMQAPSGSAAERPAPSTRGPWFSALLFRAVRRDAHPS